ncbi:type II secretion system F family protein [Geodermatophilus sp. URMC 64]
MSGSWPALLALAAAVAVWSPAGARTAARVRALAAVAPRGRRPGRVPAAGAPWQRRLLAGAAGCAVGLLVGGTAGAVAAVVVGLAGERVLRGDRAEDRNRGPALERELPAAADLLAVCLAAGMPVSAAVGAVAEAVGEPLAGVLRGVTGLYRLGAEPRRAWSGVPAEVVPLGRVLVRAGESGSAVGSALRALAADGRAVARGRIEADVRRAGVWVLAPLGLCFLPAFVCLGVVPLVLGIAGQVFR